MLKNRTSRDLALRSAVLAAAALVAAAPVLLMPVAAAFAQNTTVPVGSIFAEIRPTLEVTLSVLASGAVGLLAWGAHRLIGVNIDAKMTTMLHDMLMRAVHSGLDAVGRQVPAGATVDVRSKIVAEAIAYARAYSPKLLAYFGLSDADLTDLIKVHLAKIMPPGVVIAATDAQPVGAAGAA